MLCSKCGKENADDAKFCFSCGEELNKQEFEQKKSIVELKRRKPIFLWIGIGLLVVIAIVIISVFLMTKSSEVSYKDKMDLGQKYLLELNYDQAILAYKEAIKIDPKNKDAYIALAELYLIIDEPDKAEEILDKAKDRIDDPDDLEIIEKKKEEILDKEKADTNKDDVEDKDVDDGETDPEPDQSNEETDLDFGETEETESPEETADVEEEPDKEETKPEDTEKEDPFKNFKEYDAKRRITYLSASSTLIEENYDHSVYNIFDENRNLCWCEGVKGTGSGESISIEFDSKIYVSYIDLFNGYSKNKNSFENNGKLVSVRIGYDDGYKDYRLNDLSWEDVENNVYTDVIRFEEPIYTASLKIEIIEAVKGAKYSDTCISKLGIIALGKKADRKVDTGFLELKAEDINGLGYKELEKSKNYVIDLDGDGKKEILRYEYPIKKIRDEYGDIHVSGIEIFIGDRSVFKDEDAFMNNDYPGNSYSYYEYGGLAPVVELVDLNPSDKYKDITMYGAEIFDSMRWNLTGYRYKNNSLSLLFTDSNNEMEPWFGKAAEKQQNDDNVCLLYPANTVAGGLYIERDYKIEAGILKPIYTSNNVYRVQEKKYKVKEKLYLYDNEYLDGDYIDTVSVNDNIKILKVKYRYSDLPTTGEGVFRADLISAYIKSDSGQKGWISMEFNDYYGIIVDNDSGFCPM